MEPRTGPWPQSQPQAEGRQGLFSSRAQIMLIFHSAGGCPGGPSEGEGSPRLLEPLTQPDKRRPSARPPAPRSAASRQARRPLPIQRPQPWEAHPALPSRAARQEAGSRARAGEGGSPDQPENAPPTTGWPGRGVAGKRGQEARGASAQCPPPKPPPSFAIRNSDSSCQGSPRPIQASELRASKSQVFGGLCWRGAHQAEAPTGEKPRLPVTCSATAAALASGPGYLPPAAQVPGSILEAGPHGESPEWATHPSPGRATRSSSQGLSPPNPDPAGSMGGTERPTQGPRNSSP